MTIDTSIIASLKAIGAIMTAANDPWWIIASAAVALHGADPGPIGDVDVLLSVDDATRILPAIGIELRHGTDHPDFRSGIFGTWTGTTLPVEFMADFYYRSGIDWVQVQPATRQLIDVDGIAIFVPDRAELQRLLEHFGRPKDIERALHLAALR